MGKLSLKAKLYVLSSFLILLSAVIGGTGYWAVHKTSAKYSTISDVNLPNISRVLEMNIEVRGARIEALHLIAEGPTAEDDARSLKNIADAWTTFDEKEKEYLAIPFGPGEEEVYNAMKAAVTKLRALVDQVVVLHKKNPARGSAEHKQMADLVLGEIRVTGREVRAAADKLAAYHSDAAKVAVSEAGAASSMGTTISLLVLLCGGLLGAVFSIIFSSSLVKTLRGIVESLSQSSQEVSAAAAQIASSSEELSQATTEQAASLEETASAVEEMSSMVNRNSENAKNTTRISAGSKDSAEKGRQVIEQMIGSMTQIDQSNSEIMAQVNESNAQIAQIVQVINEIGSKTKVINDIVFQTKLLSFNASVEAARAGEQGKGFAVVAEEVGNLAQMSGNAAKEISTLLEASIQKVELIVGETKTKVGQMIEGGRSKVESGMQVARECGEVLEEIVKGVTTVSGMANEISVASDEQAKGTQEITRAMAQLDQVTQQNAATSQEAASAAEELSAQAGSLKAMVSNLVATVEGGARQDLPEAHPGLSATSKKFVKPSAKVIPMKTAAKQPAPVQYKKASGDNAVPSHDDPGFAES